MKSITKIWQFMVAYAIIKSYGMSIVCSVIGKKYNHSKYNQAFKKNEIVFMKKVIVKNEI